MGTNFYTVDISKSEIDNMSPEIHIGKRSSAGMYCWDCGVTLCKDGEKHIHHVKKSEEAYRTDNDFSKTGYWALPDVEWHDKCPKCGKKPKEENLEDGAAGRELGFNKSVPKKKKGVKSCCSFSWAMEKEELFRKFKNKEIEFVYSEYGDKYTLKEFKQVLEECPIKYTHSIGEYFC